MSILSDGDIEESIKNCELNIEPFNPKNLTPNGYDLSIGEIFIKRTQQHVKQGEVSIPPLSWFAISTKEYVKMGACITSQLWIRSSYARKGILASFGKVDAGFEGNLTISCFNSNDEKIEISVGDRFCQIVFENMSTRPNALYCERSGSYQKQQGVTLEK